MTTNPFKDAESVKTRRYMIGIYGDTGTGKTNFALSAPSPCVIDTEGGTTAYRGIRKFDVLNTQSYVDILNVLTFLESQQHSYQTLIIDPGTILYDSIQAARAERNRRVYKRGMIEGDAGQLNKGDWGHIKRIYSQVMRRLVNMTHMNVIVTFREKPVYGKSGDEEGSIIGYSFDGEKTSKYYFDIWGRMMFKDIKNKETGKIEQKHVLYVEKARGIYSVLDRKQIEIPVQKGFDKIDSLVVQFLKDSNIKPGKADVKYPDSVEKDADGEPLKKPPVNNKQLLSEDAPPVDDSAFLNDPIEEEEGGEDNANGSDDDYRDTHPTRAGQHQTTVENEPAEKPKTLPWKKELIAKFRDQVESRENREKFVQLWMLTNVNEISTEFPDLGELPDEEYKKCMEWCIWASGKSEISDEMLKRRELIIELAKKANAQDLSDAYQEMMSSGDYDSTNAPAHWLELDSAGLGMFLTEIENNKRRLLKPAASQIEDKPSSTTNAVEGGGCVGVDPEAKASKKV